MSLDTPEKKQRIKPGKVRYASVKEMLEKDGTSEEVRKEAQSLSQGTHMTKTLARMRIEAGFTQEQLAAKIGVTQSCISKLESGNDEDITLKTLVDYSTVTDNSMGICIGKQMTPFEAVRYHALEMRSKLRELAHLANKEEDLETVIQGFFGEAFFNIMHFFTECQNALPNAKKISDTHVPAYHFKIRSGRDLAGLSSINLGGRQTKCVHASMA